MSRATFSDVRARIGGLKGVITRLGDAPDHEHKWGSFPKCPFCSGKNCAGVLAKGDAEFFKCHHSDCSTGGTVMREVGYIAAREGLSDAKPSTGGPSDAYKRLLQLAGMWEEPGTGKGSEVSGPRSQAPQPKSRPGDDFSGAASLAVPMAALPAGAAPDVSPPPSVASEVQAAADDGGTSTTGSHPLTGQAGAASSLSDEPDASGPVSQVPGEVGW